MLEKVVLETVCKGYHECKFLVGRGDKFIFHKMNRGYGNSITGMDDRGILGNLEKKLGDILSRFQHLNIFG